MSGTTRGALRDVIGTAPRLLVDLARLATPTAGSRANAWRGGVDVGRRRTERAILQPGHRGPGAASGALVALSEEECWQLLETVSIGRLAFTAHSGVPVIVPVNYVVDGRSIVIRTGHGPKRSAGERGDLVAFEVDDIDTASRTGQSVVVTADTHVATHPRELARLRGLPLQPWASGPRDHYVVLTPRHVAGRRLSAYDD